MFEENWTACADFPNIVAQRKSYAHAASDEMFCQPAWLSLLFASQMHCDSAKRHILGVAHPGRGYDPQIRTLLRFLYDAPSPKFHHPVFTRSEVIVLTNTPTNKPTHKQTDPGDNIQRTSLRYNVG